MTLSSIQGVSQLAAAFLGASVEAIEAMTIVLAAGVVRGWRSALGGTVAGLATLAVIVALFGRAIGAIPIEDLQLVVGALLLLFGIRWLRKAMLRWSDVVALHDEDAIYAAQTRTLRGSTDGATRWDAVAMLTAYKAVVLEGIEVIVIVIGVGAAGNMLVPASIGALAACALVAAAGMMLHRPLASVPENVLKYAVGVLMTAFGWFWFGEGVGIHWPYGDAAILMLIAVLLAASTIAVRMASAVRRTVAPQAKARP